MIPIPRLSGVQTMPPESSEECGKELVIINGNSPLIHTTTSAHPPPDPSLPKGLLSGSLVNAHTCILSHPTTKSCIPSPSITALQFIPVVGLVGDNQEKKKKKKKKTKQ
ncbi:hypothetical protein M758_8G145200 [Ceratodon purpureus]|nr:hypothetical protein M758_8G145200 [Ceratodon purpureus]